MQKPDLFAAPELRGYQENLVGATLDALAHPKEDPPGVILQSHCGSGKTAMNLAVAKHFIDKGQPVVYLVHKAEILEQTYNAAQAWGTVSTVCTDIGIVKAGQKLRGTDFPASGSVQSADCVKAKQGQGKGTEGHQPGPGHCGRGAPRGCGALEQTAEQDLAGGVAPGGHCNALEAGRQELPGGRVWEHGAGS